MFPVWRRVQIVLCWDVYHPILMKYRLRWCLINAAGNWCVQIQLEILILDFTDIHTFLITSSLNLRQTHFLLFIWCLNFNQSELFRYLTLHKFFIFELLLMNCVFPLEVGLIDFKHLHVLPYFNLRLTEVFVFIHVLVSHLKVVFGSCFQLFCYFILS